MANFLPNHPPEVAQPPSHDGGIPVDKGKIAPAGMHVFHTPRPGSAQGARMHQEGDANASPQEPVFHRRPSKAFVEYYAVTFLLFAACTIGGGYELLQPKILQFRSVNEEITAQLKEAEGARMYLDSLNTSIASASKVSPDALQRVNEALPKQLNIPKLLQTMDEISRVNNIDMGSVQFSPGAPIVSTLSNSFSLIPIKTSIGIEASGYRDMKDFLMDLETNVRLIDIDSISVNGDKDGKVSYTLQMTTYSLGEPTTPTPVSIPLNGEMPMTPGAAANIPGEL